MEKLLDDKPIIQSVFRKFRCKNAYCNSTYTHVEILKLEQTLIAEINKQINEFWKLNHDLCKPVNQIEILKQMLIGKTKT